MLVDRQAHPRQLGQHPLREPAVDEHPQAGPRLRREQKLDELGLDPLDRDDLQGVDGGPHRLGDARIELDAECRDEARRPHHPQRIVGEGHRGRTRRAQASLPQILEPAVRIEELQLRQPQGHRVDGEVAPHEVGGQIVTERDDRLARHPVVGIGPVGRDLDVVVALAQGDRAEVAPHVPLRVGPARHDGLDLLGSRARREVQIATDPAEEGIAHRAADEREFVPRSGETPAEIGEHRHEGGELAQRDRQELGLRSGRLDRGGRRSTGRRSGLRVGRVRRAVRRVRGGHSSQG